MKAKEEKAKLHLSIDAHLRWLMDIQCAKEKRKISVITEELYEKYLHGKDAKVVSRRVRPPNNTR